jgi:hypothetical protein
MDVAVLGRGAESEVNGGVAVEGTGIGGLAGPRLSCDVMTFDEPGGTAGGGSAQGSSCATFRVGFGSAARVASARLRAPTACTLLGSKRGGSVVFLT